MINNGYQDIFIYDYFCNKFIFLVMLMCETYNLHAAWLGLGSCGLFRAWIIHFKKGGLHLMKLNTLLVFYKYWRIEQCHQCPQELTFLIFQPFQYNIHPRANHIYTPTSINIHVLYLFHASSYITYTVWVSTHRFKFNTHQILTYYLSLVIRSIRQYL
jgi:hypothetical protein